MKPLLTDDAILCTDGGGSGVFAAVACEQKLTHRFVNVRAGLNVVCKVYHVQNVNATKYLPNYLGWRRMLEHSGVAISPALCLALSLGAPGLNSLFRHSLEKSLCHQ